MGNIVLDRQVDVDFEVLGLQVSALLGESTGNLASLGRLCQIHGCTFRWDGKQGPRFWDPEGTEIRITTRHYVPYLVPHLGPDSLVCGAATEDGDEFPADDVPRTSGLDESAGGVGADDEAEDDGPPLPPPLDPPERDDPPEGVAIP